MPSAKPDWKEVDRIRRELGRWERSENLFKDIYFACRAVTEGGYITQKGAKNLLKYLRKNSYAADLFPNSVLRAMLEPACKWGGWSSEREGDLLGFIMDFEVGERRDAEQTDANPDDITPPDYQFRLAELLQQDDELAQLVRSMLFDPPPPGPDFYQRFVGFTGKIEGFSRRQCFDVVRQHGGAPSVWPDYLDYFFAGDRDSVLHGGISNGLAMALYARHRNGWPEIYSGADWLRIVGRSE